MDVVLLRAFASAVMCLPSRCVAVGIHVTKYICRMTVVLLLVIIRGSVLFYFPVVLVNADYLVFVVACVT
jgi:hypothetical protein